MLSPERKAYLLERLATDGRLVVKDLSRTFDLSADTIRRDLRELAAEGRLQRVSGGALPASPAVADFAGRQSIATAGKVAIGKRAASMVQAGQVVFIDGGTTAVQLARHLPQTLAATIVTHSPSIAVELAAHEHLTIELIGGRLFKHSVVTTGAAAIDAIQRFRPDCCFLGVTGVHEEAGLTTGDAEEALIKRAVMRCSGEVVVMASGEKLGAASSFIIAPCAAADVLLVEPSIDPALRKRLSGLGCSVVVSGPAVG